MGIALAEKYGSRKYGKLSSYTSNWGVRKRRGRPFSRQYKANLFLNDWEEAHLQNCHITPLSLAQGWYEMAQTTKQGDEFQYFELPLPGT